MQVQVAGKQREKEYESPTVAMSWSHFHGIQPWERVQACSRENRELWGVTLVGVLTQKGLCEKQTFTPERLECSRASEL